MATANKNTDTEKLKKYFIGEGKIKLIPLGPFELPLHWNKIPRNCQIHYSINPKTNCPICEIFKPKTRLQRIKERLSKLWKRWIH